MNPTERLAASYGVRVRSWGEDASVVFCAATNSTHLVTADAGALLVALGAHPGGIAATSVHAPRELVDGLVLAGLLQRVDG